MDELRPCPFCGGEAIMEKLEHEIDIYDEDTLGYVDTIMVTEYMVTCRDCECSSRPSASMDMVAEAWNSRTVQKWFGRTADDRVAFYQEKIREFAETCARELAGGGAAK